MRRVISAQNHYLMVSMMQDVIRRGTATKARSLGQDDLAGKPAPPMNKRMPGSMALTALMLRLPGWDSIPRNLLAREKSVAEPLCPPGSPT